MLLAGSSLLTLLDDIATLLDDISVMGKLAAKKTNQPNGNTHPFQFARFNAKQAAEAQGKEGHCRNHHAQ